MYCGFEETMFFVFHFLSYSYTFWVDMNLQHSFSYDIFLPVVSTSWSVTLHVESLTLPARKSADGESEEKDVESYFGFL